MNRQRPIGIFDSGLGGLTVVRQIRRVLPEEDLVYLGDTARVPYGTKSPGTVVRFACEDTAFLLQHDVKAVVVACNTASAWALPGLKRSFDLPIFGVIGPGAEAALRGTQNRRIGVIGTKATVLSHAYERWIHALNPQAKVFSRACPLLVPLVEEGWIDHAVTRAVLAEYLGPLLARRIDTLVLGCTHYPLLKSAIQSCTGRAVTLVDSAESCAADIQLQLEKLGLLQTGRRRPGRLKAFVTDEVGRFEELASRFLGFKIQRPLKVDLDPARR